MTEHSTHFPAASMTPLPEGEFSRSGKAMEKRLKPLMGIYRSVVTAIYLGWSLYTFRWEFTRIVWLVAAVLCGAIKEAAPPVPCPPRRMHRFGGII